MGDVMYTIDRIEDELVTLENRDTKEIFIEELDKFPLNIKEGDIVERYNDKYIVNIKETERVKKSIRNRFNSLIE